MAEQKDFNIEGKKLFPFFGKDLVRVGVDVLRSHLNSEFTLMPFDSSAIGLIQEEGLPFTLIDQWTGSETIIHSRERAAKWEREWFIPARDAFTSNGICWPIFDKEAMYWFWRELAMVNSLAEIFRRREGEEIKLLINEVIRPSLYYYPSDLHGVLLKSILDDRVKSIKIPLTNEIKAEYNILAAHGIMFRGYMHDQILFPPSTIKGKVVLAINPGEFQRFSVPIQKLSEKFPGEFAAMMIFPDINSANRLSKEISIPVISPMQSRTINSYFANRFWNGYNKRLNSVKRTPWETTFNPLEYHFKYYCKHRWPVLASNLESWLELWSQYPPKAVIISNLPDSESKLPAAAAKRLGIPTLSLPHGGFGTRDEPIEADYALYNSLPVKTILERSGTPPERLKPSRDVLSVKEYTTVQGKIKPADRPWRLLILPGNMLHDGCIFPLSCPVSHIDALEALDCPPDDIAGKISLKIKPHPGFPELELFQTVSIKLAEKLYPPNFELSKIIEQTDLVIALNYSRTALISTLRTGKPVIFFWTDPLIIKNVDPNTYAGLLLPAGILVQTAKDLWDTVRRFFTDSDFADKLRSKAQNFTRENLDDSTYPNIGEVVNQVLSEFGSFHIKNNDKHPQGIKKCMINRLLPDHASIPVTIPDSVCDYGEIPLKELEIICKIVSNKKPITMFEIGTFKGRTTLCFADNSTAQIYTLDLPPKCDDNYVPPEFNDPELDVYPEKPGEKFCNTKYASKIIQIYGDSQTFNFSPYFGNMDLVFVDACHHFNYVLRDSMNAFKMIKSDGIIIWHDYASYAPGVMQALEVVSKRFQLFHVKGTSLIVYYGQPQNKSEDIPDVLSCNVKEALCKIKMFQKEKKYEFALKAVELAIQKYPGSLDLLNLQAELKIQTGNINKAKRILLEIIKCSPSHIDALNNLGVIEFHEGNLNHSIEFFKNTLVLDPANEYAISKMLHIQKIQKNATAHKHGFL